MPSLQVGARLSLFDTHTCAISQYQFPRVCNHVLVTNALLYVCIYFVVVTIPVPPPPEKKQKTYWGKKKKKTLPLQAGARLSLPLDMHNLFKISSRVVCFSCEYIPYFTSFVTTLLCMQKKKKLLSFQAGARLSLSIKEVDQTTGEDLMPGRGHEAAAKLADELKSNPSGPGGGGGKAASNPLHPGLTQEKLRAMEAEEEVCMWYNRSGSPDKAVVVGAAAGNCRLMWGSRLS